MKKFNFKVFQYPDYWLWIVDDNWLNGKLYGN